MGTLRSVARECVEIIGSLCKQCGERRVPLLKRLLDTLDYSEDSTLFTYVYVSVYVCDENDDDICSWHGGPEIDHSSQIPPDHPIYQFLSDLRVLLKYTWEMLGASLGL